MKLPKCLTIMFCFVLFGCYLTATSERLFALERSFVDRVRDFSDILPPARIKTEKRFTQAIRTVSSPVFVTRPPFQGGSPCLSIYTDIAMGDYQGAIEKAQKGLKEIGALGFLDEKNGGSHASEYSELLLMLGIAYELKGDWVNAVNVYAVAYGEYSKDFRWAKIRILYSVGRKKEAFMLVCDAISEIEWTSVDSVKMKINEQSLLDESHLNKGWLISESSTFTVKAKLGESMDSEWLEVWRFRDNCARVICPEAPFVSSSLRSDFKKGGKSYFTLQKESFEAFVDFMEDEYEGLDDNDEYKNDLVKSRIQFLKEFSQLTYK